MLTQLKQAINFNNPINKKIHNNFFKKKIACGFWDTC